MPAERRNTSDEAWRKALLVCGVASSLLYALMIWGIRYEAYNPISQVPSELTAMGAPTRALWARLGWIYTVLVTAFGIGVWKSAGGNRAVRAQDDVQRVAQRAPTGGKHLALVPREERRRMCRPFPFQILEGEARYFAVRGAS